MDQENVLLTVEEWRRESPKDNFFFRGYGEVVNNEDCIQDYNDHIKSINLPMILFCFSFFAWNLHTLSIHLNFHNLNFHETKQFKDTLLSEMLTALAEQFLSDKFKRFINFTTSLLFLFL